VAAREGSAERAACAAVGWRARLKVAERRREVVRPRTGCLEEMVLVDLR